MKSKVRCRRNIDRRVLGLVEGLEERVLFAANALDMSFGSSGRVLASFGVSTEFDSVTVLPGGKVLAAGTVDRGGGKHDFVVARYNANGSVDTSFGGGTGRVFTDFSGRDDYASKVVQLSGGKFAVVGRTLGAPDSTGNPNQNMAVARYNANGSLDTSFRGTGKANIDFTGDYDAASSAAVLSTGKLLVIGFTLTETPEGPDTNFAALRFNADGSLDNTFGTGGKLSSNFGSLVDDYGHEYVYGNGGATAVAVLPSDGFILAGGIDDSFDSGTNLSDFAVAKYTASGKLDTAFGGGDGWMQVNTGERFSFATAVSVLGSGKIVVGGTAQPYDTSENYEADFALTRINANGTLDTSFGNKGTVTTTLFSSNASQGYNESASHLRDILVQPNGKILATGPCLLNDGGDTPPTTLTAVARYNANGSLDTSFSSDGKQLYGQLEGSYALAPAPGGKTLIAGYQGNKAGIIRFQSDSAATASISGTFFNDLDNDGVKDANEKPLVGWTAFVDSNNDGVYTPGEMSAVTNSSGKYTITGLTPGTYRIREVRLNGWNRTKPGGAYPAGFYDVTLAVGQAVFGKDFGNKHV